LYGLPGLLTSLSMLDVEAPVDVYGPRGLAGVVEVTLGAAQAGLTFPLALHELEPGLVVEDRDLRVRCAPLDHVVPCFGFRVEQAEGPGRLDVERARALGVTAGPDLGKLKGGGAVLLADGTEVRGSELVAQPVPGRVVTLCGDTLPCDGAVELGR